MLRVILAGPVADCVLQPVQPSLQAWTSDLDAAERIAAQGVDKEHTIGQVIGMASAMLDSPIYGIAVRAENLQQALEAARRAMLEEQRTLRAAGCYTGVLDGMYGPATEALFSMCRSGGIVTASPIDEISLDHIVSVLKDPSFTQRLTFSSALAVARGWVIITSASSY